MPIKRQWPLVIIIAGLIVLAVSLPLALYLKNTKENFRSNSIAVNATVIEAGENIRNNGRAINQQKITVQTSSESIIGEQQFERQVKLPYNEGYQLYTVGEVVEGRVLADDPESFRLENDASYQANFFTFMAIVGALMSAGGGIGLIITRRG